MKRRVIAAGVLAPFLMVASATPAQALSLQDIIDFIKNAGQETTQEEKPSEAPEGTPESGSGTIRNLSPISPETYQQDLASLREGGAGSQQENSGEGYDRNSYKHWSKVVNPEDWGPRGQSGEISTKCDTREATLIRQADVVTVSGDCVIESGEWTEAYGVVNGDTIEYPTFTASNGKVSGMDNDHVVALKSVERSGGFNMDDDTKEEIANDPINLIVTSARENRSKSDKTAEAYLPADPEMRCVYASQYVQVKKKYDLSVSEDERKALEEAGQVCGF